MVRKYSTMILFIILITLSACSQGNNEVDSFTHVHGLSYDLSEPHDLYLGTHYGVFSIDSDLNWVWKGTEETRHDLMGFTFIEEGRMISSGHPNAQSDLMDPVGIIISEDKGETWEPIALHGEVDFHVLEVNASESGIIYGLDAGGKGLHLSQDSGYNWDLVISDIPINYGNTFSIVSDPISPNRLLAGTQYGIFKSEDSGETWELIQDSSTIFSAKGAYGQSGTVVAYFLGEDEGLMITEDFGQSWLPLNLQLIDDAVVHIAIHPVKEGTFSVGTVEEDIYQTIDNGANWIKIADSGVPITD
ncbi:photosystem II stability/assembly factor-like uncharacterized protein [Evansella vedderi]|uniref:Photosystem II stability/assembly factor-like uncharacterized protein n=1 Tax=Evansella vedderi TaxID=38282 RepID=A0ABT9ZY78_9BACI|nr:hypothetical protein [Evansella vedderi]MDQ0256201.1 photosystem II stability/assembly factor-like uncharacterized protein [Evansella vedderi]